MLCAGGLVKTYTNQRRTKHIESSKFWIRQFIDDKKIIIKHVATEQNVSDIFTKGLPAITFNKHKQKLNVAR